MVKISTDGYMLPQSLEWHEFGKCHEDYFPLEGDNILLKKKNSSYIRCGSAELLEDTAIFVDSSHASPSQSASRVYLCRVCFIEDGDCFAVLPESCDKAEQEEQP